MTLHEKLLDTPVGPILVVVDESGCVVRLDFHESANGDGALAALRSPESGATAVVEGQLVEYFAHRRRAFTVPIAPQGTPFQQEVWARLRLIPYGETRTYGRLATEMGRPDASRAIGRAAATNPIAILVPCHRLIGSNGDLTGFAGGLQRKAQLLAFEQGQQPLPLVG